ncbi:glycosyltransferase [Phenylobacterium hankyongense]|uniref:Glycosyltransferase n=1 Tax=Phenylobacterium hankyongense TaxID=1813876 RepID=A0A328B2K1_9CAUL|nr:nucleotide disphospho-sugar-binding domain-containing protein [Phenylobacterium hankyongense]RAK60745.1 glycosyltransferase [Phenylobacterium hankyongense]
MAPLLQPQSFLIATWEGGGSVPPALTVARKLVERGHAVRVMSDACNGPEALATGAAFTPWTRAPSRADRTRASELLQDWRHPGPDGLRQTLDALWTGPALRYAEDVIEALRRDPVDLVVTSEMLFGVAAGCEAVGQRFACLAANLSLVPIPGVPPFGPGLAPAKTEEDRALHGEIAQFTVNLFDHGLPALNAARAGLGLAPLPHTLDQLEAAERTLLATARAFDFAPDQLPERIRYVGPQLDNPGWAEPWTSPFPADDRRPLVLAGFSTTFQNHAAVLQRIIDAAAALPVRLVVTLGGSIAPDELRPADNTRLLASASHDAVMREAALVVTHGGHGTVMRALIHRRPLLVIPHGRDQNDNAIRVTERAAGLSLLPDAGEAEIRGALQRLLAEPAFVAGAERLGAAVAHEAANSPVVEELEALVGAATSEAPQLCPA